jgi:hypothetical protein
MGELEGVKNKKSVYGIRTSKLQVSDGVTISTASAPTWLKNLRVGYEQPDTKRRRVREATNGALHKARSTQWEKRE